MIFLLVWGPIVRDDAMDVPLLELDKPGAPSGLLILGVSALRIVHPKKLFRWDLVRSMDPIRTVSRCDYRYQVQVSTEPVLPSAPLEVQATQRKAQNSGRWRWRCAEDTVSRYPLAPAFASGKLAVWELFSNMAAPTLRASHDANFCGGSLILNTCYIDQFLTI